jgi:signal transduction histidine kinase
VIKKAAMSSIKWRLAVALGLVELFTLAMALMLYVGAQRLEQSSHSTSRANDEVRDLLSFALLAHRYMNAFGQSLGQRTLIANHARRTAASAFQTQIGDLGAETRHGQRNSPLNWSELERISSDLNADLGVADGLRERGKFYDAERAFGKARQEHFEARMLPWFESSVARLKTAVSAEEAGAIENARSLRAAGTTLGLIAVLLGSALVVSTAASILRPISQLLRGTEEIAKGNLTHRVLYKGKDELATLAAHFNDMAQNLTVAQERLVEHNRELEEAHRLQGEFLSIVSHELRSPLHSVVGYTELVLEDEPTMAPRSQSNMQAIALSARRLLALINDILDFSKLRAGRMEARIARFDLIPLLLQVLDDARALARGRELSVELDGAPATLWLESDEGKVRQILTNLLSNAVKFTDRGAVSLIAETSERGVALFVSDTGVGIPVEQQQLIFEPFRQAQSGIRAVSGTGLGLAIVARLSALLGGTVSLDSVAGRGSRFRVELPLELKKES